MRFAACSSGNGATVWHSGASRLYSPPTIASHVSLVAGSFSCIGDVSAVVLFATASPQFPPHPLLTGNA